jgi:hypothetical protein
MPDARRQGLQHLDLRLKGHVRWLGVTAEESLWARHCGNVEQVHAGGAVATFAYHSVFYSGTRSRARQLVFLLKKASQVMHLDFFFPQRHAAHNLGSFVFIRLGIAQVGSLENGLVVGTTTQEIRGAQIR